VVYYKSGEIHSQREGEKTMTKTSTNEWVLGLFSALFITMILVIGTGSGAF
jgi:hypothetical protein